MKIQFGSIKTFIYWPIKFIGRVALFPFFRIQSKGLENLPKDDPFILLAKHQRWEDIPLLGMVLPKPLYYIAKYELFLNPIAAWFISSLGGIPLNRARPMESRESIVAMMDCLKKGEGVVIFPEGTYYQGTMGKGKTGLLRMIQSKITIPVIPVGLGYTRNKIRTLVKINFGKPVYEDAAVLLDKFPEIVMKEMARLSGLIYGEQD
ncbi:lysophospholipid acyltransferase family protein [Thermodesulfobacteriota bacterium]